MKKPRISQCFCCLVAALLCFPALTFAEYVKHGPQPPDANKVTTGADLSCWLATAANMLAGADYGTGVDEQARSEEIYDELRLSPEMVG